MTKTELKQECREWFTRLPMSVLDVMVLLWIGSVGGYLLLAAIVLLTQQPDLNPRP